MRMYVANTTRQNQLFMYFVPEQTKRRQVPIPPLSQILLPEVFASQAEVDFVVRQHEHYGFIEADKASMSRKPSGFHQCVFAIDKPVTGAKMQAIALGNRRILDAQGRELRQAAAIAANNEIVNSLSKPGMEDLPGTDIGNTEFLVQEETASGTSTQSQEEMVSEGFRVKAEEQLPAARASVRGNRARR